MLKLLGRIFDSLGRIFDSLGRIFVSLGRIFDSLGRIFDSLGRIFDSFRENLCSWGPRDPRLSYSVNRQLGQKSGIADCN